MSRRSALFSAGQMEQHGKIFKVVYQLKSERLLDRITLDTFPEDRKYYTLTFPVARYKPLSL